MPIQINARGAQAFGHTFAPYMYVDWLSPGQEAVLVQGGDAVTVPPRASSALAGGANLSATIDGSGRLATVANNATGRAYTVVWADALHPTIRDNGTPQAEVALVLDGSGRFVSATGNF